MIVQRNPMATGDGFGLPTDDPIEPPGLLSRWVQAQDALVESGGAAIDDAVHMAEAFVDDTRSQLETWGRDSGNRVAYSAAMTTSNAVGAVEGPVMAGYDMAKGLMKLTYDGSQLMNLVEWAGNPAANAQRVKSLVHQAAAVGHAVNPELDVYDPGARGRATRELVDAATHGVRHDVARGDYVKAGSRAAAELLLLGVVPGPKGGTVAKTLGREATQVAAQASRGVERFTQALEKQPARPTAVHCEALREPQAPWLANIGDEGASGGGGGGAGKGKGGSEPPSDLPDPRAPTEPPPVAEPRTGIVAPTMEAAVPESAMTEAEMRAPTEPPPLPTTSKARPPEILVPEADPGFILDDAHAPTQPPAWTPEARVDTDAPRTPSSDLPTDARTLRVRLEVEDIATSLVRAAQDGMPLADANRTLRYSADADVLAMRWLKQDHDFLASRLKEENDLLNRLPPQQRPVDANASLERVMAANEAAQAHLRTLTEHATGRQPYTGVETPAAAVKQPSMDLQLFAPDATLSDVARAAREASQAIKVEGDAHRLLEAARSDVSIAEANRAVEHSPEADALAMQWLKDEHALALKNELPDAVLLDNEAAQRRLAAMTEADAHARQAGRAPNSPPQASSSAKGPVAGGADDVPAAPPVSGVNKVRAPWRGWVDAMRGHKPAASMDELMERIREFQAQNHMGERHLDPVHPNVDGRDAIPPPAPDGPSNLMTSADAARIERTNRAAQAVRALEAGLTEDVKAMKRWVRLDKKYANSEFPVSAADVANHQAKGSELLHSIREQHHALKLLKAELPRGRSPTGMQEKPGAVMDLKRQLDADIARGKAENTLERYPPATALEKTIEELLEKWFDVKGDGARGKTLEQVLERVPDNDVKPLTEPSPPLPPAPSTKPPEH
jgi:hypothetical protein